jgi:outer membrane protein TolC
MDKRRAVLAQSKLMVSQSEAERELALNDLMFEAMDAYLQWALQFQNFRILTDAVRINEERYELIKVLVIHGDRAGVDSTEALTQLLNFRFLQNQALLDFQNSGNELSNFLWTENNQPYQLPADVLPSVVLDSANPYKAIFQPLDDMLNLARNEHPKLRSLQFKVDVLDVERRLKFQSLLPTVNLKYNALSEGYEFFKGMDAWSFENNYKFGVDVGLPLFLRQGRGDYQSAKLKLQSTQIDQDATMLAIENKVRAYYNNQVTLLQQIKTYEEALAAYQRVYDVELMRFEIGESTLFLINSRENKLLETRQKLAELKAKFFKSLYGVQWSAGTLR